MNNDWEPEVYEEIIDPVADSLVVKHTEIAYSAMTPPKPIWECYVFGNPILTIAFPFHVNWWKRMWMKVFFGSKFKKL